MRAKGREVDFDYIFAHYDQTKHEIPFYYDREVWKNGQTYAMRVSHIYDPSKFWIVIKEQELRIFQEFLKDFYTKNGNQYKMPMDKVCRNIYCVVYVEDNFYRGVIVSIPPSLGDKKKAWVFFFDFGYVAAVTFNNIYFLYEKMYQVPRFAVRACLSYVRPYRQSTWDDNTVRRLGELVLGKRLLCILDCTDPSRKIVFIAIGDVQQGIVKDVGKILLNEKLAEDVTFKRCPHIMRDNNSRYVPITKYPFLFPSFEAIEAGKVPSSVYTSEMLMQSAVPPDVLFKLYFIYRGILGI